MQECQKIDSPFLRRKVGLHIYWIQKNIVGLRRTDSQLHGLQSQPRAIKTSCFDGILSSLLRETVSIGCGDFSFLIRFPLVEKAQQLLLHKLHAWGFSDLTATSGKIRCQRHLYSALCTLVFQIRHVRAFLVLSQPTNARFFIQMRNCHMACERPPIRLCS